MTASRGTNNALTGKYMSSRSGLNGDGTAKHVGEVHGTTSNATTPSRKGLERIRSTSERPSMGTRHVPAPAAMITLASGMSPVCANTGMHLRVVPSLSSRYRRMAARISSSLSPTSIAAINSSSGHL